MNQVEHLVVEAFQVEVDSPEAEEEAAAEAAGNLY